jgi:hypothetical protein
MVRLVNEDAALRRGGDVNGGGQQSVVVKMNVDRVHSVWEKREEVLIDSLIGLSFEIIQNFDASRVGRLEGVVGGLGSKAAQEVEKRWWDDFGPERDVWIFFRRQMMKIAQDFEARLERDMMEKERKAEVEMALTGVRGRVERDYYKDVVDDVRKRVAQAVVDSLECEEARGDQAPGTSQKVKSKMKPGKVKELGKSKGSTYVRTGRPVGRPRKARD